MTYNVFSGTLNPTQSIIFVSYQSFYMDLNAGQPPRWMHAGLMLLISGAWEGGLESNGTNMIPIMRWGG